MFHVTGSAKKWQGVLNFKLNGNLLKIDVKDAEMVDIFKTLGYEPLLIGKANSSLKVQFKKSKWDGTNYR